MRSIAALPLLAIASLVGSQTIQPSSVPLSTRDSWCTDQTTTCPLLCTQETNSATTYANDCDPVRVYPPIDQLLGQWTNGHVEHSSVGLRLQEWLVA